MLVTGVVAIAALAGTDRARGCGHAGFTYAGVGAARPAFGIAATVSSIGGFAVLHGHVAGWVGVGGPGEGPGGRHEWLQIGLSAVPGEAGSDLYYEVALPSRNPVYHRVAGNLPARRRVRLSVLEMHGRPDWWHVRLNGRAVSKPILLPQSHGRWAPIATAESWDGGTGGACNTFLYRFHRIRLAQAPGGGWHPFSGGFPIRSSPTRVRRAGAAFLAAERTPALRLLRLLTP